MSSYYVPGIVLLILLIHVYLLEYSLFIFDIGLTISCFMDMNSEAAQKGTATGPRSFN